MARRDWLAGGFFVADILMADVLRLVDRFDGLAARSAGRATARPAFRKAHADQLAHLKARDEAPAPGSRGHPPHGVVRMALTVPALYSGTLLPITSGALDRSTPGEA